MNLLFPIIFLSALTFAVPNPIPTYVRTPEKTPTEHHGATNTDVLNVKAVTDTVPKKTEPKHHDKGKKHDNKDKEHKLKKEHDEHAPAALEAGAAKATPKVDARKAHTTKHEDAKPTAA